MNYEQDTKDAYRNKTKAKSYQDQYIKGMKWARFTMWRQKRLISRLLSECNLRDSDKVLDIPCGTGYIGNLLSKTPAQIYASDISLEMMDLAYGAYETDNFHGFVQSNITENPFKKNLFSCVIVLALMHRLPKEVREKALTEIAHLSNKFVIMSYSLESPLQKLKQWLLKTIQPSHIPAPSSLPLQDIIDELNAPGLSVRSTHHVVYFLSAKIVFFLEKKESVHL